MSESAYVVFYSYTYYSCTYYVHIIYLLIVFKKITALGLQCPHMITQLFRRYNNIVLFCFRFSNTPRPGHANELQRLQRMHRLRTGAAGQDGFRISLFRTWDMKLEQKCSFSKKTVFVVRKTTAFKRWD